MFWMILIPLSFFLIWLIHLRSERALRNRQLKGLQQVLLIKKLINAIQQHRGVSSAWLSGDKSKQTLLRNLELKVREFTYLLQQTELSQVNERWESYEDHWSRLLDVKRHRTVENNFKQHTTLILNLQYMLEDEAERFKLDANQLPALPNIGYTWRELVQTAECIGQSRAIGTGIATAKYCSSVDKIRLSFLEQNIVNTTNETLGQLSYLNDYQNQHRQLLSQAQDKLTKFTDMINLAILNSQKIELDADIYFNMATDCINSLDMIFEHQLEQIRSSI